MFQKYKRRKVIVTKISIKTLFMTIHQSYRIHHRRPGKSRPKLGPSFDGVAFKIGWGVIILSP